MEENEGRQLSFSDVFMEEKEREERELEERWRQMEDRYGTLFQDRKTMILSALLHDCDDHKLFHTENNANARRFLEQEKLPAGVIEEICKNINSVSFSKNRGKAPETIEGKIVQDADRLEAIGAVGIARCFQFGGSHGRSLENSIEHFYEKLLLIPKELNTPSARKMAEKRDKLMQDFLKEWVEEMN